MAGSTGMPNCYLEGYLDDSRKIWRTPINRLPFQIGRHGDSDMVLPSGRISQRHAVLFARQGELCLEDLRSTNGTYVNGRRLREPRPLQHGDVIYFADREFRLVKLAAVVDDVSVETLAMSGNLPVLLFERSRQFRELLTAGEVKALWQPLVELKRGVTGDADSADHAGRLLGYELLGRAEMDGEEVRAAELFLMAETLGLEVELSTAFRARALCDAMHLPAGTRLFLNTHPAELADNRRLLESVLQLRQPFRQHSLVLEIHERAVPDLASFRSLRAELATHDVELAFDDFGTGQARLYELLAVAPQFVKFDRAWIADIDRASPRRLEMVHNLVRMVAGMDIATVAEGIERPGEARVCRQLGFDYAQGYFFGYPEPVSGVF